MPSTRRSVCDPHPFSPLFGSCETNSLHLFKDSSYGINFERASVLFNLGAAYSQKAHQQNLKTAEGVKMAFNFFQLAAGSFALLKDNSPVWFPTVISSDLAVSTLASLELLMLAQAQECFLLKAVTGFVPALSY